MLLDVMTRLASDTGLDVVQQRETLLAVMNNAAKDMYDRLECSKIYWEVTLEVPRNMIVTLPNYLGELRGMRTTIGEMIFPVQGMSQPRYTRMDWAWRWKNWRDLGESPIAKNPAIVGPLTLTINVADTPLTVYISGQTANALKVEETVILNSANLSATTVNSFGPAIYTISCLQDDRQADIHIADANANEIAILYNTDRQTRYKTVDVSEAPWSLDVISGSTLIDVLFKVPLRKLTRDSDNFPASADYDAAWYYMSMSIYYRPMQNKPPDYANMMPQAMLAMSAAKNSGEQTLEKKISFGRNKYYNLTKSPRGYWPGSITNVDTTR